MFLGKLGYSELVQRLFEKMTFFLVDPLPQSRPKLVYLGDAVGLDLSTIPLWDQFIWVWAHSVFSKTPVLRQAKMSELMAIWDYEGKLESRGWSREQRACAF